MIPFYLTEEDVFSASQVCHHWRSVLISSPSLWTGISCRHVRRTIASLERCGSLPIRLWLEPPLPTAALENVRLHEKKVISLTVTRNHDLIPQFHHLVMHFRSSMERLHIWSDEEGWRGVRGDRMYSEMWHDFLSLRELFISQYSISAESLSAPNLAHLALECIDNTLEVQSILGLLRGCPLLETLLIHWYTQTWSHDQTPDHSPINLSNPRILEFGPHEATLMLYLRFPPGVAVGFPEIMFSNEHGYFFPAVAATIQDMVERAGGRRIILAVPTPSKEGSELLIRFGGLGGSLEMTTCNVFTREEVQGVLFGPEGSYLLINPISRT